MLKSFCFYAMSLSFMCCLEGVSPPSRQRPSSFQEKEEIIRRDEIDNTDTFAIPFDESEVETEEQINRDEGKQVFPLPQAPKSRDR